MGTNYSPVLVYASLFPSESREKFQIVDNSVHFPYEGEDSTLEFDRVFSAEVSASDLYHRAIGSLLPKFIAGNNCSVLLLSNSGVQMPEIFGSQRNPGVIYMIIDAVVHQIAAKKMQAQGRNQPAGQKNAAAAVTAAVSVNCLEIFEESAVDLLHSDAQTVFRIVHGPDGVAFQPPPQRQPVVGSSEVPVLVSQMATARARLLGAADAGISSILLAVITLEQIMEGSKVTSNFFITKFSGVQKLAMDQTVLAQQEGPNAIRSLLSFASVVKGLTGSDGGLLPDFSQSIATQLLAEQLGGNCYTIAVGFVSQEVCPESLITLSLASQLRRLKTFPVVEAGILQGLSRWYRRHIATNLMIAETKITPDVNKATEQHLLRIRELEESLLDSNLSLVRLQDEKENVRSSLKQTQEKFQEVSVARAELRQKLLASEEGRLKVSKALIEQQLGNSSIMEQAEKEKFDVTNRLITAEDDILKLQTKLEEVTNDLKKAKGDLESAVEQRQELASEYIALKANYKEVREELGSTKTKSDDLSVEMVNLLNIRDTLQKQLDENMDTVKNAKQVEEDLLSRMADLKREKEDILKESHSLREQLVELRSEMLQRDGQIHMINKQKTATEQEIETAKESQKKLAADIATAMTETDLSRKASKDSDEQLRELKARFTDQLSGHESKFTELLASVQAINQMTMEGTADPDAARESANMIVEELRSTYGERIALFETELRALRAKEQTQTFQLRSMLRLMMKVRAEMAGEEAMNKYRDLASELRDTLMVTKEEDLDDREKELSIEVMRARETILRLEDEVGRLRAMKMSEEMAQTQLSSDVAQELSKLRVENRNMKGELKQIREDGYVPENKKEALAQQAHADEKAQASSAEVQGLKDQIAELTGEDGSRVKLAQTIARLKEKIRSMEDVPIRKQLQEYVQKTQSTLEKEKSQLKVRAVMAEEQLAAMKEYISSFTKKYEGQINVIKAENSNLKQVIRVLEDQGVVTRGQLSDALAKVTEGGGGQAATSGASSRAQAPHQRVSGAHSARPAPFPKSDQPPESRTRSARPPQPQARAPSGGGVQPLGALPTHIVEEND